MTKRPHYLKKLKISGSKTLVHMVISLYLINRNAGEKKKREMGR
jgi:hypothetical protein